MEKEASGNMNKTNAILQNWKSNYWKIDTGPKAADHEKVVCCFFTNFVFGFFKKYAARLAVEKAIFSICLTNALLACEILN